MVVASALVYAERATRWQKLSPGLRLLARRFITTTLIISAGCTAICLYLAFTHGDELYLSMIFGLLGAIFQMATVYWLAVERPETPF